MNENALFPIFLKIFTVNAMTNMAILFFGFICQNINSRVLQISQIGFSRQELSIEQTMSFVTILNFNLCVGFADLLGARGTKAQGEKPSLVNILPAWQATFICLPACMAKKFFDTLMRDDGWRGQKEMGWVQAIIVLIWWSLAPALLWPLQQLSHVH